MKIMCCWLPLSSEYFAFLSLHENTSTRKSNAACCNITRVEFVRAHGGGLGNSISIKVFESKRDEFKKARENSTFRNLIIFTSN
jgi:hypothetical protein